MSTMKTIRIYDSVTNKYAVSGQMTKVMGVVDGAGKVKVNCCNKLRRLHIQMLH